MVASVVDLPEPVPPTTITSPRLLSTPSLRIGGLFLRHPPQQVLHQLDGLITVHGVLRVYLPARSASQRVLVLRLEARFFLADDALGDQLREALVESLHALRDAGLNGGVHLR